MKTKTKSPKVVDLGFANGWQGTPMIIQLCRQLDHKTQSTNLDKTHHGLDTKVSCDKCKYSYHYDSSDCG